MRRYDRRLAEAFHDVMGGGLTVDEIYDLIAILDVPELPPHYHEGQKVFEGLMQNTVWRRSNDGWWVAIKGPNPEDITIGRTFWDVLRVARDDWQIMAPFVTEVGSYWLARVAQPKAP